MVDFLDFFNEFFQGFVSRYSLSQVFSSKDVVGEPEEVLRRTLISSRDMLQLPFHNTINESSVKRSSATRGNFSTFSSSPQPPIVELNLSSIR